MSPTFDATIVIPTKNEAGNARELITRIAAATAGRRVSVLFVDDGDDDLPEIAAATAHQLHFPVQVIRRTKPEGGLGGAVTLGMQRAAAELIVVCDGDLQHPPETIPLLLDAARTKDLVVASRYTGTGAADGLSTPTRKLVSRGAGYLTKAVFPMKMRDCSDPMSGFFAVHRAAIDPETFHPSGFKILLEIITRSPTISIGEVAFCFAARHEGASHAGMREMGRFLTLLARLRIAGFGITGRMLLFGLVGLSGIVPNLVVLEGLTALGMNYVIAAILAIQVAIVWNFIGAELLVWRYRRSSRSVFRRFWRFALIAETDAARIPFVVLLVEFTHSSASVATIVTLVGAFVLRFLLTDQLVYGTRKRVTSEIPDWRQAPKLEPAPVEIEPEIA